MSNKKGPGKSSNKDKILKVSLRLFNEKGSADVSTNHICEACSISPGNLYYHYRNKDEIILTLFKQMVTLGDERFSQQVNFNSSANEKASRPSIKSLETQQEMMFYFLWEFRFIHREMSSLHRNVSGFANIFKEAQKRRLADIKQLINIYCKFGVFRKMKNVEVEALVRTIWFFSLYWLAYLETEGKEITKENIKESVSILRTMLNPYILQGRLKKQRSRK